ncbi:MAG TPA: hypothetical protein VGB96_06990 [Archangium sp.]
MATIIYQIPAMPTYGGWEAPAAPGEFHFKLKTIVESYRRRVQAELPHIHMHSRRHGIYREYVEAVKTLAWLEERWLEQYPEETPEAIPWPKDLQKLWAFCGGLIFSRRFERVLCPACKATYAPEQTQVVEWRHGESLAAHGGKGLLCPNGHGLYVIVEWDS